GAAGGDSFEETHSRGNTDEEQEDDTPRSGDGEEDDTRRGHSRRKFHPQRAHRPTGSANFQDESPDHRPGVDTLEAGRPERLESSTSNVASALTSMSGGAERRRADERFGDLGCVSSIKHSDEEDNDLGEMEVDFGDQLIGKADRHGSDVENLYPSEETSSAQPQKPFYFPASQARCQFYFALLFCPWGCRSVEEFECLNRIEEGTYGVVYRARDKKTGEIVALKRLKMEKEHDGFPITSLREISTLMRAQHENIVTVREIVVGSNMDKIYLVMEYVEHDLKALMEVMNGPFTVGEVKCLLTQLLRAVAHLHDNWILHRDLKTSNLLLSHKGILKDYFDDFKLQML
ncbi:unnamed protein product, partial [Protopolystoma xenopodis]